MDKSDNFSWRRVNLLATFYKPWITRQILVYFGITVVFFVLLLLPVNAYAQAAIFSMCWTAIGIMVEVAPIVVAKSGDSRLVERLIPASAAEKFTLFVFYFFIVIPVTCYFLPDLAIILYQHIPSIQTEQMNYIVEIRMQNPPMNILMNCVNTAAVIITCLYVVLSVKHNRMLKGIVSVFVCNIALGIIGAFYGMVTMFKAGYDAGVQGHDLDTQVAVQQVMDVMQDNPWGAATIVVLVGIYSVYMLCATYRKIKSTTL